MKLWIVQQVVRMVWDMRKEAYVHGSYTIETVGVFESEALAIAACRDANYFIAQFELNEQLSHETEDIGAYYPLADKTGDEDKNND